MCCCEPSARRGVVRRVLASRIILGAGEEDEDQAIQQDVDELVGHAGYDRVEEEQDEPAPAFVHPMMAFISRSELWDLSEILPG